MVPTGILGLDNVLGGGLPAGGAAVVCGGPGSGKTLFGLQFLAKGVREHGEPGIFVSFEEGAEELRRNAQGFDWRLDELGEDQVTLLDINLSPDVVTAGDFDLGAFLAGTEAKVQAIGARRIVLDSLDVVLSLLDDPRAVRRELSRLQHWLRKSGLTGVLSAKFSNGVQLGEPYGFLEYLADAVIVLHQDFRKEFAGRSLQVVKRRGASCMPGRWPFEITRAGLGITADTIVSKDHPVSTERVTTGIRRLDRMLDGGYFRGSSILISGASGTAKTTLAAACAEAACRRGDRTLFISFDEVATQVLRNMRSVAIDLEPHVESGQLHVLPMRARQYEVEAHFVAIRDLVNELQPACLVVDSVAALMKAGEAEHVMQVTQRLFDLAKRNGITAMFTSLTEHSGYTDEATLVHVSTIADNWLHLSYVSRGGERNRALNIVKARGTNHSNQVRELILDNSGVDLADVYIAGGEVLMGTARLEKEQADAKAAAEQAADHAASRRQLKYDIAELNAQLERQRLQLEEKQAQLSRLEEVEGERVTRRREKFQMLSTARRGDPESGSSDGNAP